MTDIIERVARAIADKTAEICARTPGDCVAVEISAPEVARAAILAMREPTEGMIGAGDGLRFWKRSLYEITKLTYTGMIDAALQEKTKLLEGK